MTRRYGGTGLGLSIVKQLIELQDGYISVQSEENVGTRFTFTIPYKFGSEKDLIQPRINSPKKRVTSHSFYGLKVLLVEDNDINRLYALNILKKWNCTIDQAENGYTAVEKLKVNDYDIILMDVQMPIMDGYEATKTIRRTFNSPKKDIPIIALTANAIKGDNEKCIELGMNDYLSKPFQPEDLYEVLSKFANEKEPPQFSESNKTIDLTYLRGVCNGDQAFMRDMIETFISNTPVTLEEMQEFAKKSKWQQVGELAHKIKPSITFMGIDALKTRVRELEVFGKEKTNIEKIPPLIEEVSMQLQTAISELKEILNNDEQVI